MCQLGMWSQRSSGRYTPTPFGELFRTALLERLHGSLPFDFLEPLHMIREAARPSPRRLVEFSLLPMMPRARTSVMVLEQLRAIQAFTAMFDLPLVLGRNATGHFALACGEPGALDTTVASFDVHEQTVFLGVEALEVALSRAPGFLRLFERFVGIQPGTHLDDVQTVVNSISGRGWKPFLYRRLSNTMLHPIHVVLKAQDRALITWGYSPHRSSLWVSPISGVGSALSLGPHRN